MSYIGAEQLYNRPQFRFRCRMAGKGPGKNLFSDFVEEPESEDAIKVFLRLKPNNTGKQESILEVLDSRTLLFKTPSEFIQARKKLNMPDQYKYTFSKIFEPDVTQRDIFNGCVAQHVKDLFDGEHCLLFTYGTTNAGKTFTVLGNGDNPGIIPRTLTTVFKSIRGKQYNNARITPHMFNSALEVTDKTFQEECCFKYKILTWNPDKTQSDSSRIGKSHTTTASKQSFDEILDEPILRQMQSRLTNEAVKVEFEAEPEDRFSVWISFAEIYNEAIYDLLQPMSQNCKRQQLKISRDMFKNCYIKGLKHIFVENEEEAYKVLRFGKNNLQVAATGVNSSSSRSHCIFSIKLMKCPNVEHPERVVVSSFSICDLAGAERQKKTLNDGLRLKESQNINSSLLVLSRCFSIIRENQMANEQKLVPFRESKLTQLFQHALLGKESVTMIVNVNSEQYLYEETQHVLKASAIAKHIVVQHRPVIHRPPRPTRHSSFSQLVMMNKKNRSTMLRWDSCVKPKAPDDQFLETIQDSTAEVTEFEQKQEQYEELLILVDSLKEKLKEEKEKNLKAKKTWRIREDEIRDEMKAELNRMLDKVKAQNELDQRRVIETREDKREKRLEEECIKSYPPKKAKTLERDNNKLVLTPNLKDLQDEVKIQRMEIEGLTKLVELFKEEKKELTMDLTYVKMQLSFKERDIENLKKKMELFGEDCDLKAAYMELEKEMEARLKQRDNLLEEARAELLDELQIRDENEEEIKKLEEEIMNKDEKIRSFIMKLEDLNDEVSAKTRSMDMLENNIDDLEMELDDIKKRERQYVLSINEQTKKNKILQDEFDIYKQETDALIESLKQKANESIYHEELKENLLLELEDEFDERIVEIIVNLTEENELRIEQLRNDVQLEKTQLENKLFEMSQLLESERSRKENLKEEPINPEELKENLLLELEDEFNEKIVEMISVLTEENELRIEELRNDLRLERTQLENKLFEMSQLLESERSSKENLKEELTRAKESLNLVQQELTDNGKKISEFEQYLESETNKREEMTQRHNSEVAVLEQNLKAQIQETTRLWTLHKEKKEQIEKLTKELNKSRTFIDSLNSTLKSKDHDLECSKSKLMGYQNSVPTLQLSFERQQNEISEYKRKCEDLMETIINMEKEQTSFQSNQKEIIGKYEDQLKKTKDENETLKKEVARVTSAFYKSTPTPKKELQMQIEDLKKQLEEAQSACKRLEMEKENLAPRVPFSNGPNKENEYMFEHEVECARETQDGKLRTNVVKRLGGVVAGLRSRSQDLPKSQMEEKNGSKSDNKNKPQRLRATALPQIEINDVDNVSEVKKPVKQSRKKLWDASSNDDTLLQLDNVEFETNVPQDSPGTIVKRSLRSRNKENTTVKKKCSSSSDCCIGCCPPDQRQPRRKLFSQDYQNLHELNISQFNIVPIVGNESPKSIFKRLRGKQPK